MTNKHIELPALIANARKQAAMLRSAYPDHPPHQEAALTLDQAADELAAHEQARVVGEPVAWQFRWTNPGNNPNTREDETAWKPLEPRGSETMQQRVAEIEQYTYDGKPCYEVRALGVFASPPAPQEAQADTLETLRRARQYVLHASTSYYDGSDDETDEQIEQAIAALRASSPADTRNAPLYDPSDVAFEKRPPYCGSGHCSCIECHFPVTKERT